MEQSKISSVLMLLNDKLDPMGLASVKSSLEKMDDSKYDATMAAVSNLKSPTTSYIFSISRSIRGR